MLLNYKNCLKVTRKILKNQELINIKRFSGTDSKHSMTDSFLVNKKKKTGYGH